MGVRSSTPRRRLARTLCFGLLATGLLLGAAGSAGWAYEPTPPATPDATQPAATTPAATTPGTTPTDAATPGTATPGTATPDAGTRPDVRQKAVTLLTGDRVTVAMTGDRVTGLSVRPAAARRDTGITFRRFVSGSSAYVIPSDVAPQVANGRLDRRLFDVAALIEAEYDDEHTGQIPLIVSYRPGDGDAATLAGEQTMAVAGARSTRPLAAVNGAAVKVDKSEAARFMDRLPRTLRGFGGGVHRIWLDGKAEILLDESVPQIGAPKAWAAGYTGQGITVGVLDTGIDAGHPDLADAVLAAEDFTGEGVTDENGHGTHVASTITGSGTASNGQYAGVAPDARLLSGKVCDSEGGCAESWILAGMEWAAVDQDADIINMSLGGLDSPGIDPMEAAVNNLTERSGTLFVIAAGNSGPDPETILSPGSADAALTVGAVDKSDQIAEFSSRGPRIGDGAVKPDITAPGVDIVAARAEGTELGPPVGEDYVLLSGTSMATPHVVGAAAILAEQHTAWQAAELKAALMGSALPNPGLTVYDQGAGRVDVAAAIAQAVYTEPASMSYGIQEWPHHDDQPVGRTLTYHNDGAFDVTLDLSATFTGPDGEPAPEGSLTVSPDNLTVPAGGTAAVTVTVSTRHTGPNGAYGGTVTATGPGVRVTTPVAVIKEIESYDLRLSSIDRNGQPAPLVADVLSLEDPAIYYPVYDESGTTKIRVPAGDYLVQGFVESAAQAAPRAPGKDGSRRRSSGQDRAAQTAGKDGSGQPSGKDGTSQPPSPAQQTLSFLAQPTLAVDRDIAWTADARQAEPLRQTVPPADAEVALAEVMYDMDAAWGEFGYGIVAEELDGLYAAHLGPDVASFTAALSTYWGRPGTNGTFRNTPYAYAVLDHQSQRFWTGYERDVRNNELARVRTRFNAQAAGRTASLLQFGSPPHAFGGTASAEWLFDAAARTTFYMSPAEVTWSRLFTEFAETNEGGRLDTTFLDGEDQRYRAGRTYTERWNSAVFGPDLTNRFAYAERRGGEILVSIPMYADGDDHAGDSEFTTARTALYRDGQLIEKLDFPGAIDATGVAPKEADFLLETSAEREFSNLTTTQTVRWSFRSAAPPEGGVDVLPLWVARLQPRVDKWNVNRDGPVTRIPVTLEALPVGEVGKLTDVAVDVSTDDGATWTSAPLVPTGPDTWQAIIRQPADAAYVSLRVIATDALGNSVEQTTIRAYALP